MLRTLGNESSASEVSVGKDDVGTKVGVGGGGGEVGGSKSSAGGKIKNLSKRLSQNFGKG